MSDPSPLAVKLIVNPEDDGDFRDLLARLLLTEFGDLDGVADASLPSAPSAEGERGAMAMLGQVALKVAPDLLGGIAETVADWIRRDADRVVEIEIDGRKARFPADTSPEKLQAWLAALQGESG